jgi:transposase-like protein
MADNEKLTTEQVIAAIHQTRGMITLTAQRLGVAVNTVRRYIRNYKSVQEALDEERDRTVDIAELKLFDAINRGEAWSIALTLKTLGKNRGYVERQEHTGADGGAIGIQFVDYRNNLAQTPGRSTEDSDPSGES